MFSCFNICAWETKEDFIKTMSRKLFRILNNISRLEALPARFDEGVEVTHRELMLSKPSVRIKRINITDLGHALGVTKSAASQMVAKLAKKGLVEKESSARSNKELQLSLTQLGWRAFHFHERFHGDHMTNIVDRLGAFSLSQIATTSVLLDVLESVVDERLSQRTQK
jgi:DNA-binding MarR family transcriptional regulator